MENRLKLKKIVNSKVDNTIKYIFYRNHDNAILEFSYISKNDGKDIICVPSQTMCAIGCKFCHTTDYIGKIKVNTILGVDIVEGVDYIYNDLKLSLAPKTLLVSFMGCGEPVLNYKNVVEAMGLIKCEYKNIYTRFAIATSLPDVVFPDFFEMTRLIKSYELPVKLHVSLHYTNDKLRNEWMPKAINIESTLAAAEFFKAYTNNPVEIHYALIEGVNDTGEDAIKLCGLIKGKGFNVKFLFYNEKTSLGMHPSEIKQFEMFKMYLDMIDVPSEYYKPPGLDVGASCGQFLMDEYLSERKDYGIKCIGSTTGVGGTCWFYKFVIDDNEYLIMRINSWFELSKWTKENKLDDHELDEKTEIEIKEQYELVEKSDVVFDDFDDFEKYFTKHEIKEEVVTVKKHKGSIYTRNEIQTILEIFNEWDLPDKGDGKIDQEMIDYEMEEYGTDCLKRLKGYKVAITKDGEHKTDGQMVEYSFYLTSPKNIRSFFSTEKCLMVGWNYCDEETIIK